MIRKTIPIAPRLAGVRPAAARAPRRGYFVYLLCCGDGTLYAGYTRDLARRLAAHRAGRAARYTRGRGPWEFAAAWRCDTAGNALRLERLLKRLGRAGRLRLAGGAPLGRVVPAAAACGARRVRPPRPARDSAGASPRYATMKRFETSKGFETS